MFNIQIRLFFIIMNNIHVIKCCKNSRDMKEMFDLILC